MLVPGLGPHRVVAELLPVQMELASDEVHDRRGNELARGQQSTRVAEDAQLQREAELVAGTPPDLDVLQVLVAQGVAPRVAEGKTGPTSAGRSGRFSVPCSFTGRMRNVDWDTAYDTGRGSPEAGRALVSQTSVCDTC